MEILLGLMFATLLVIGWFAGAKGAASFLTVICLLATAAMARAADNDIPAWAYLPEASSANSLFPKQPAAPATGMNSPLVQQALALQQKAADIEMYAARFPNDPRVRATAAAMATDLRGRAAIMMQVNSDNSRRLVYCRLVDGRFVQC